MERSAFQPLVLASASPRRLELVSLLGIPFEVIPSRAEENDVTGSGKERVRVLARRKGEEVAARLPGRTVLAADTLVCVENEVLGKPVDEADAARMIRLLSGRSHWVYTGVCLLLPDGTVREEVCGTEVCFARLDEGEILRYAASGEPMDKAGAYAVQGRAGAFVRSIHGRPPAAGDRGADAAGSGLEIAGLKNDFHTDNRLDVIPWAL